jgi:hypothetical protein
MSAQHWRNPGRQLGISSGLPAASPDLRPLSSFVGRRSEIEELKTALAATRLLTLDWTCWMWQDAAGDRAREGGGRPLSGRGRLHGAGASA